MLTAGIICVYLGTAIAGTSVIAGILNIGTALNDDRNIKSLFKRHLRVMLGMVVGFLTLFTGVGLIIAHFVSKYA